MANTVIKMLNNIKNVSDKLAKKLAIQEKQKAKKKKPAVKRKKKRTTGR